MGMGAETDSLRQQMDEVRAKYPSLQLEVPDEGRASMQGVLRFDAEYDGKEARGDYEVRIHIPAGYPNDVPMAYETGGVVPGDFHKYRGGALCLGAPLAVRRTFQESPTLLGFVENLLIPHLFSHAYYEEHGEMPFGELRHGVIGLVDFYKELFHTDLFATLSLLKTLADGSERYKGYLACPCASDKPLGDCHGPQVAELWTIMQPRDFAHELTPPCQ